jgi:rare lipoprotein A (peptidoglycan hydrolase)
VSLPRLARQERSVGVVKKLGAGTFLIGGAIAAGISGAAPKGAAAEADIQLATSATGPFASWYGGVHHGRLTANGERFDRLSFTAAHTSLPFGTIVRVTDLANGRSVLVRINDRGPFRPGRVIDLSEAAARQLDMLQRGVVPVAIDILER